MAAMSHRAGVLGWPAPMPPVAKYALTYLFVQAEFGLMLPGLDDRRAGPHPQALRRPGAGRALLPALTSDRTSTRCARARCS